MSDTATDLTLLEHLEMGIAVIDTEDQIQFINKSMRVILIQLNGDDLVFTGSELMEALGLPLLSSQQVQDSQTSEKNNQVIRVTRSRIAMQNEEVVLVQAQDMSTERRKNNALHQYTSDLLLKVRSRITPIQNALTLILDYPGNISLEESSFLLGISSLEMWQLERWLDSLRDFSMLNSGSLTLQLDISPCSLLDLVQKSVSRMQRTLKHGQREFSASLDIEPTLQVLIDPTRLLHILEGLLINSIDYCAQTPSLAIQASTSGERVLLRVKDNGIGISQTDQPRIFEYGFRASSQVVNNVSGLGTDLWFSRNLLSRMDGRIEFESSASGSTFLIDLPISHG